MNMEMIAAPAPKAALDLALLKAVGLDRAAPEQRQLAIAIAERYGLDLMLKHLVLIDGKPYVTRDALLHIAHRSGQFDGIQTTTPEIVGDEWRCSATVWRKDMSHPFTYGGRYPVKGRNANFAPEMAIKVAESMALRRAFNVAAPVAEERWDVDLPTTEPEPRLSLAERAAVQAATPAEALSKTPQEAAEAVTIKRAARAEAEAHATDDYPDPEPPMNEPPDSSPTVSIGLSIDTFRELCVKAGKMTQAIAGAIDCVPADVKKRVEAMSPVERGVLADELGIEWRNG